MKSETFATKKNQIKAVGEIEYPARLNVKVTTQHEAILHISALANGAAVGITEERPVTLMFVGDYEGKPDVSEGEVTTVKLNSALQLLERATTLFENEVPDDKWFRDYFLLTGQHAIETDDGWVTAETYIQTDDKYKPEIQGEVNAPEGGSLWFRAFVAKMIQEASEGRQIMLEGDTYEVAEVLSLGLHLTRDGDDAGVFSFEELFEKKAAFQDF